MTETHHEHGANSAVLWTPGRVDTDSPTVARVNDYLLGGAHNFAADRELAERFKRVFPAEHLAHMSRSFVGRAVRHLVSDAGIRQFLDLSCGIPTNGNVHEIAQRVSPDCRAVYVGNEPVSVAASELILEGTEGVAAVAADLYYPNTVRRHPDVLRLIDFDKPVALIMCGMLEFIPDNDDPAGIVAAYRDAVTSGSRLIISHATADDFPDDLADTVRLYANTPTPITPRTHTQIEQLIDGVTLAPPGLVYTPDWRADDDHDSDTDPRESRCYGGVAVV